MPSSLEQVKAKAGAPRLPEGMSGLAKGLAIIELLGAGRSMLTIAEAANATGISRAAARRCLLTLVDLGYLASNGKFFTPQPRLLRLGRGFLDTVPIAPIAQPVLEKARDAVQESVSLALWDNGWTLFVARAEAARIVSTGVRTGARLPAYCSATGRVFLRAMSAAERAAYWATGPFVQRTPKTIVDPAALEAVIAAAQQHSFCLSDEELELGMRSAAVPVRDPRGRTIAAMSVSMASARVSLAALTHDFVPALLKHAALVERSL